MFESVFSFGGASYVMAFVALLVFGLFTGVVLILLNDTARRYFKKAAFPLLVVAAAAFIVVEIALLQIPPRSYDQGYQDGVGRPDASCPVFRTDDAGNLITSDDGASPLKHEYKLKGRPAVLMTDGEIHLWLANRGVFADGTHLCSLPLTSQNAQFAEKSTNAWDALHGEPESGAELRKLREQAAQNGEGSRASQQGGGQQDVVITLPSEQNSTSEENSDGEESQNGMANNQQSQGTVTIQPSDTPQEKQ